MLLFEMGVMELRTSSGVSTLLAHVDFVTALFVSELEVATVHLATVRLQRAALSEGLAALAAPIRTNSCLYTHTHITTPWAIKKGATFIFTITLANVDRFQ